MYIKKLTLSHFGKFHKKEIVCKPGINIIYGGNEAGKSTIHSFIRGMLFGIEKSRGRAGKDDLYTKYQPLTNPGLYEGSMEFTYKNEDYLIFRRFYQKEKYSQLVNLTMGKELKNVEGSLCNLFPDLTESAYRNTVSVEQLRSRTDIELANEVRNYIANLSTSKTSEVDVNKAISTLLEKKKEITSKNILDKINKVEREITESMECERSIEEASKALRELYEQKKKVEYNYLQQNKQLHSLQNNANSLAVIRQKYEWYAELLYESEIVSKKIEKITKELSENSNKTLSNIIDGDIKKIDDLCSKQEELRERYNNYEDNHRHTRKEYKGKLLLSLITLLLGIVACFLPFGSNGARIALGFSLVALSFTFFGLTLKRKRINERLYGKEAGGTENEIIQIEKKKKEILLKYNCSDFSSLREYQKLQTKEEVRLQQLQGQLIEYQEQKGKLVNKLKDLYNEIFTFTNQIFHCNEVSEKVIQQLEYELNQCKIRAKQLQDECENEKMNVAIQIDRLENLIVQFQEKESGLNDRQKEYEDLLCIQREDELTLEAIKLTIQTIKDISSEIHDDFGSTLGGKVSEQLSAITDGRYKEVLVDENLNIKILHELQYIPIEKLSVGAIDQVYFALRMAISDLLFDGDEMPLILDDSFAFYDDERLKSVLQILASMKNRQIFIFTCHHREQSFLLENGTSFHYVTL